jgi:hypothetical protein
VDTTRLELASTRRKTTFQFPTVDAVRPSTSTARDQSDPCFNLLYRRANQGKEKLQKYGETGGNLKFEKR